MPDSEASCPAPHPRLARGHLSSLGPTFPAFLLPVVSLAQPPPLPKPPFLVPAFTAPGVSRRALCLAPHPWGGSRLSPAVPPQGAPASLLPPLPRPRSRPAPINARLASPTNQPPPRNQSSRELPLSDGALLRAGTQLPGWKSKPGPPGQPIDSRESRRN